MHLFCHQDIFLTLENSNSTTSPSTVVNPYYKEILDFFEEDRDQFEVDVATTTIVTKAGKEIASTTIIQEIALPDSLKKVEIEDLDKKIMPWKKFCLVKIA